MAALHRYLDPDSLSWRRIEITIAGLTLLAIGGFLASVLGTDTTGFLEAITSGSLRVAFACTLVLPVIIVLHVCYDTISWLRGARNTDGIAGASAVIDALLRIGELLLSLFIVTIIGSALYLFTTVPTGRGAGSIIMGVVFTSGLAVTLLSVLVLVRQAARWVWQR